ncbi:MAG: exonuclease domain-containing protein [Candidatus Caldarchaeum sp.]
MRFAEGFRGRVLSFLDLETTGLRPEFGDRVCEIAIISVRDGVEEGAIETLVCPQRPIPFDVQRIHGITNEMVASAPTFGEIAPVVAEVLGGTTVVAHNAPFDMGFLYSELRASGIPFPDVYVIDTLRIARNHFSFPSNSLTQIARSFGLTVGNAHRAMEDAKLVKEVFYCLIDALERDGSFTGGIEELLGLEKGYTYSKSSLGLRSMIEEAIRLSKKLEILYYSSDARASTIRVIEPLEINSLRGEPCILAYCHLRGKRLHFRFDRILSVRPLPS